MTGQRYSLLFLMMLAFMCVIPTAYNLVGTEITVDQIPSDKVTNYEIANGFPPMMLIDSEDDFATHEWTGDGSAESPYTLEDKTYTHYSGIGYFIEIRNTRSNFTIKSCTFNGDSNYATIFVNNVTNGVVTGCAFNVSYAPVLLWNSPGFVIDSNTIKSVSYGGYFSNSPFANFSHNIVDGFSSNGAYCYSTSTNAIIHDNEFTNGAAEYAIHMLGLGSNVTYNSIHSCDSKGIYTYANYLNISYNTICNITGEGIHFYQSQYARVEFNNIHCTLGDGMFIDSASNTLIANNTIYLSNKSGINSRASDVNITCNEIFACADYGIFLNSSSSYTDVKYNYIGWNGINGREDGYENEWDSNFYSDYVSGNYLVPGTESEYDLNPGLFNDSSAPIISDESNIHFFETQTGNHINWTFSDDHPYLWALELDAVEVKSGWWCGDIVNYYLDVDGLLAGTYNYTFIVQDAPGVNSSDSVIITVEPYDYDDPVIEGFTDQILEAGVEEITLQWKATELHPEKYVLYRNGTPIEEEVYVSGVNITYDVVAADVSSYNFTCWFNDTVSNSEAHTVWVHFVDTTSPSVNSPDDITFTVGDVGNNITWTGSELYPNSYSIYINGTLNKTGSWNGSNIVFIVDGFNVGVYNITLFVADEYSNEAIDTVIVIVNPEVTTTTTTTTTTTSTTETTTETATSSPPPPDDGMVMILAIIGGGAIVVILIIVFFKMKK